MFGSLTGIASRVAGMFRKSSAQRKLLAMLNGNTTAITGNLWANNRAELVKHFSGWNYAAIDAIATEIAGMQPHYAYQRDNGMGLKRKCLDNAQRQKAITGLQQQVELEPVDQDHPLIRLDARPNPIDVHWTYWYKVVMFLRITGEAYLWDVPDILGVPKESWVIPSHWVWPVPGEGKVVHHYDIRPIASFIPAEGGVGNWGWFGGTTGHFPIPANQIIPICMPSPHSLFGGYAPLTACSTWTDCTDNIDRSRVFKFQNDAFPTVAVEFDKDIDPESITQPEIDRLKLAIKDKYAGVRRTGEPVVLGPGMRLVYMQSTPRDMDYVEGFAQMRDSLMAAHRTGPMVVGMANETTHAAGRAARAGWHVSTITPIVKLLGQIITECRCRKVDESLVCYWMDSKPEDVEFEHKQRIEFFDRNLLTINEARRQVGLAPHPNEEIGNMTNAEVIAHFSMPPGMDMEQGSEGYLETGQRVLPNLLHPGSHYSPKYGRSIGNGDSSTMDKKAKTLCELGLSHLMLPDRSK